MRPSEESGTSCSRGDTSAWAESSRGLCGLAAASAARTLPSSWKHRTTTHQPPEANLDHVNMGVMWLGSLELVELSLVSALVAMVRSLVNCKVSLVRQPKQELQMNVNDTGFHIRSTLANFRASPQMFFKRDHCIQSFFLKFDSDVRMTLVLAYMSADVAQMMSGHLRVALTPGQSKVSVNPSHSQRKPEAVSSLHPCSTSRENLRISRSSLD